MINAGGVHAIEVYNNQVFVKKEKRYIIHRNRQKHYNLEYLMLEISLLVCQDKDNSSYLFVYDRNQVLYDYFHR